MNLKSTYSLLVFLALGLMNLAHAEETQGFNVDDLTKASTLSITLFKETSPDHFIHLNGFKVWKSGTEAKVKIYINHDGMTMENNYLCQKHDGDVHCTAQ